MKYRQSKEFNLVWFLVGDILTGVLGTICLGNPPFVFKLLVCGLGGLIGGYAPKMYGIIIHGDYW